MTHFMIYMYNVEMTENYPEIICALSADLLEGLVEVVIQCLAVWRGQKLKFRSSMEATLLS
jgi:hypothetical protein